MSDRRSSGSCVRLAAFTRVIPRLSFLILRAGAMGAPCQNRAIIPKSRASTIPQNRLSEAARPQVYTCVGSALGFRHTERAPPPSLVRGTPVGVACALQLLIAVQDGSELFLRDADIHLVDDRRIDFRAIPTPILRAARVTGTGGNCCLVVPVLLQQGSGDHQHEHQHEPAHPHQRFHFCTRSMMSRISRLSVVMMRSCTWASFSSLAFSFSNTSSLPTFSRYCRSNARCSFNGTVASTSNSS